MPRKLHTDNNADKRRSSILKAAGVVFLARGYAAATTLEIASKAKVSKRALYDVFGSKDGILAALIRETSAAMHLPPNPTAPADTQALLALLRDIGKRFSTQLFHADRTAMYRLAISEVKRSGPAARELELGGRKPVVDALTTLLARAATDGLVRRADIELILSAYFGILIGGSQMQLLLGVKKSVSAREIDERVALAIDAVRRLIGAP